MREVFADADIVLDLLAERKPFYYFAAQLFSLADLNKLKVYTSALVFANIHYLIRKENTEVKVREILREFKLLIHVLPVDDKILNLALESDFKDFEDAIQYQVAIEKEIDTIITRNVKDYKTAKIKVVTAEDFLKDFKPE